MVGRIGNSEPIRVGQHLQTTDKHFEAAVKEPEAVRFPVRSGSAGGRTERAEPTLSRTETHGNALDSMSMTGVEVELGDDIGRRRV